MVYDPISVTNANVGLRKLQLHPNTCSGKPKIISCYFEATVQYTYKITKLIKPNTVTTSLIKKGYREVNRYLKGKKLCYRLTLFKG